MKLETGVSGGIVFHRDTALLILPDSTAPSECERARFRQACAKLQKLEAQATIPVTEKQFREAERAIEVSGARVED